MRTLLNAFVLAAAFGITLLSTRSDASPITWINVQTGGVGQTITGPSDIKTNGTFLDGLYMASTTTNVFVSVGNTTFFHQSGFGPTISSPSGDITISATNLNDTSPGFTTTSGGSPADIAAYNTALSHGAYYFANSNPNSVTMTFSNLSVSHEYQAQIWSTQTFGGESMLFKDGFGNNITLVATPTGQFAVGQFVVTSGSTESLTYVDSTNVFPFVNAIVLRDLGVVPEPGSIALMVLGGIGLCIAARRRAMAK